MSSALKGTSGAELVSLERLAHLLKGLSPAELEILELLLDEEACVTTAQSLKELKDGIGIPVPDNA